MIKRRLPTRRVCEFLDLDRSTLFQVPEGEPGSLLLTDVHQPAGSRPPPERMNVKDFFPWTVQKILGGETLAISKMSDLPAEAGRDREIFDRYGTKSFVVVALSAGGGKTFGLLTFAVMRMAEKKSMESFGDEMPSLPPELVKKEADRINAAAEMGDVMQIKSIADDLKSESDAAAPFCDELVRLAEDFDFDGIQKFVLDLDH